MTLQSDKSEELLEFAKNNDKNVESNTKRCFDNNNSIKGLESTNSSTKKEKDLVIILNNSEFDKNDELKNNDSLSKNFLGKKLTKIKKYKVNNGKTKNPITTKSIILKNNDENMNTNNDIQKPSKESNIEIKKDDILIKTKKNIKINIDEAELLHNTIEYKDNFSNVIYDIINETEKNNKLFFIK